MTSTPAVNKHLIFVTQYVDFIDHFGTAFLSAVAKNVGWTPHFVVFDQRTIGEVMERVKPSLVCYSAMSTDAPTYLKINRWMKERFQFVSLMGGTHPTYFPEVIEEEGLDYICRGEGEEFFAEFLNTMAEGGDLEKIQNLWSKKTRNPVRNPPSNLDDLPMPDRSLIFDSTDLGKSPVKTFMASRGCPFSCAYCHNNSLKELYSGFSKHYRHHSVDRVIREIAEVKAKYPLHFIKFEDDLFAAKTSWLREFSARYKKEIGVPFNCLQRFEIVNDERVRLLKEAGCVSISMSIESANPRIRRDILTRDMALTNDQIRERLQIIKSYGLNVMTSQILGVPTSTLEDERIGLELSISGGADFAGAAILFPFPRTAIHDYCEREGLLPDNLEDSGVSLQQMSQLKGFTERERATQWNLSNFWPTMCKYPLLKPLLWWLAQNSPPLGIYSVVHVLAKSYLYSRYIFPIKGQLPTKFRMLGKALSIEVRQKLGLERKII